MKIIGLLTIVYVLGGPIPAVDTVARDFMPLDECKATAESLAKIPQLDSFDSQGRPILSVFYDCTVLDAADVISAVERLK